MFTKLKQRLHRRPRRETTPAATSTTTPSYMVPPLPLPELLLLKPERFELEALLSSIMDSHATTVSVEVSVDVGGGAEGLPSYEEIYSDGALPVQVLAAKAPTLKRKPGGLLQRWDGKSSRQMALEALMLLLGRGETKVRVRPVMEQVRLRETRRRAMERLAERGWDMREVGARRKEV